MEWDGVGLTGRAGEGGVGWDGVGLTGRAGEGGDGVGWGRTHG